MPELFHYSYKVFPFNQPGTLTDFEIPLDGRKLVYVTPTDGPTLQIRLQSKSNDQIPLRPQGVIVAPFNRIYVSGVVTTAFPSLIIASPGDVSIESRDVNVNNIALVSALTQITNPVIGKDFILDRALAGQIFEASGTFAPTAGQFGHVQVFNPAGSGKTVVVLSCHGMGAGSSFHTFRQHDTPGTLVGNLTNTNRNLAVSAAQIRTITAAALQGTEIARFLPPNPANYTFANRFDVLGESEGFAMANHTTGELSNYWFRIYEF